MLQFASFLSLAVLSLFYPFFESLDGFDSPVPASDLEIQLIALLTFVGIMFVLAHLLATLAVSSVLMQAIRSLRRSTSSALAAHGFAVAPLATASPPLALRI